MAEAAICGHATLAAAQHLFGDPGIVPSQINLLNFVTLSGNLTALRMEDKIELELPSGEWKEADQELVRTASSVLGRAVKGADLAYVGEGVGSFAHFIVIVLKEGSMLEGVDVDATALVSIPVSENRVRCDSDMYV
jgi:predicted PhzF superfamily epimerase YddE/YHI9